LKNPIKVVALADGSYEVVSGHIRLAGATQLGWQTISAVILTLTPEQARLEAILDNRGQQMNWLETAEAIHSLLQATPKPTQQAVADMLGIGQDDVSRKMKVLNLLTSGSRSAIYGNSINAYGGDLIPEVVVRRLADLGDPQKVEEALKVAIDKKMTESQAKALVASMQAGKPAEAYMPVKAAPKAKPSQPTPMDSTASPEPALSKQSASKGSPQAPQPSEHPKPLTPTPTMSETAASSTLGTGANKASTSPGQLGTVETVAWDMALGISVLAKIKAKVKKGERPTWGEALLLGADKLFHLTAKVIGWVAKHGIRGIFRGIKWVWHTFIESLKLTGLYPIFRAICFLAFCLFAIWFGFEAYNYGWMKPIKIIGSKVPLVSWLIKPSQNQTANANGVNNVPLAQPNPAPQLVASTQAPTPVPTAVEAVISTPTVTTAPKPQAKKKSAPIVAANVQPTPNADGNYQGPSAQPKLGSQHVASTQVSKTDVAGDILKAAPSVAGGVGNIAKSLGF
ncbi:MAG TPA: ParB N-terminal domain-containing protein, partial [bacterium]|nr:ParB N-terminal domain-containing protein [bacterium]